MSDEEINRIKEQFKLDVHPEGGFFKEMWRGDRQVTFLEKTAHDGPRCTGTSIYFLLKAPNYISWHKHLSTEFYYWHAGGTVKVHFLEEDGTYRSVLMGDALKNKDCIYQVCIPHDTLWAAELVQGDYSLYSAVVMPGFEYRDWIPASREDLTKKYPKYEELISRLAKS